MLLEDDHGKVLVYSPLWEAQALSLCISGNPYSDLHLATLVPWEFDRHTVPD